MHKTYTNFYNPEKAQTYTNILKTFDMRVHNYVKPAGVALTAINFPKYEEIRKRYNLSHIYCVEDKKETYKEMKHLSPAYSYLIPKFSDITSFILHLRKEDKIGFVDLDFMTFWANIIYPPNSREVNLGYNMQKVIPHLLNIAHRPLMLMITAVANGRNLNNPIIRKVSEAQDFVNLFPSGINFKQTNYTGIKYNMETLSTVIE